MLDIYTYSVLIMGILFTSFGIFAFLKNPNQLQVKLYALFSLAFAVWSFSWFFLLRLDNTIDALFFSKILNFGATFIPVFYLNWSLSLVDLLKKKRSLIVIAYLITFIFAALNFTNLFIADAKPILFFRFWPVAGPAYIWFIVFGYIFLIGYSLLVLIKSFLISSGDKKKQIGYMLLGSALGFGGGLTNFPLMYGITVMQPFGLFALMFSPILFSYAAVKYELMQIKVVATQFFLGALNVVFIINIILSDTVSARFFNSLLLLFVLYFSMLVFQSVRKEITQRQHIELLATDLQKANDRLTELDRQKSEFVSFATHQLRAPLTAMKGYASLILEGDMGTITDATREAISRIFDSSKTLANIVDDYLNITRIELGSMKYAFETISLSALIEDVIGELKPTIEKSKLDFSFTMDVPGANYRVTADRDKLKQVITNLLDNSMKYTPSGWIKVSLTMDRPRHLFVFAIKDSGIGISAETIPLLFQKFGRAHNANKVNIKGTGLGLFVAKEIIAAHHGTVRVESEGEGKGSTFIVELEPFAKA